MVRSSKSRGIMVNQGDVKDLQLACWSQLKPRRDYITILTWGRRVFHACSILEEAQHAAKISSSPQKGGLTAN